MKFVGMKELKQRTREVLKAAEREDIIITAHGKPTAVLHHVDEDTLDDYLVENDAEFQRKIEEAWREYLMVGGTPIGKFIKDLEKRGAGEKI